MANCLGYESLQTHTKKKQNRKKKKKNAKSDQCHILDWFSVI